MKGHILVLLLFYSNYSSSQNSVLSSLPPFPVSSMQLSINIKDGKEFYEMIEKDWILYDYKYIIMKSVPNSHNYFDDHSSSFTSLGISTGFHEKGSFNKGYKNGFWKTEYKGILVNTINYNNGLVVGLYRVYNSKCKLLYQTTFGSGGNGEYKDFYPDTGKLKEIGDYKDGRKEGLWYTYSEQGDVDKITIFKRGEPLEFKRLTPLPFERYILKDGYLIKREDPSQLDSEKEPIMKYID